jgi:hypothetical protein
VSAFVREVLDAASELGLRWWERLVLVLAAALLAVLGRRVWHAVSVVSWPEVPAVEPPLSDGEVREDRSLPPAREGGGESGGGTAGGMG